MARDGEVLNKAALQAAANFLQLGGTGKMPFNINPDHIQFVYDLAKQNGGVTPALAVPGAGEGEFHSALISPVLTGGVPLVDFTLLNTVVANGVNAFRIDHIHMNVAMSLADVAANAGKALSVRLYYTFPGGDPATAPILTLKQYAILTVGQTEYPWSLVGGNCGNTAGQVYPGSTWDRRIAAVPVLFGVGPMGLGGFVSINEAASNFPASSVCDIWYSYRLATNGVVPAL